MELCMIDIDHRLAGRRDEYLLDWLATPNAECPKYYPDPQRVQYEVVGPFLRHDMFPTCP